ncbi:MAG: UvrD-helicase domain-containing protein [Alphaproteobacteria bacterium]|nr:UvrD-helicase domain-containing protein [Alphaproteobacteria bacterium]
MAKKHTLSPEQDIAANPLENVWVQANAGTGKTSVLVQRLLRILFRSDDCGRSGILCLTYTNAGAGEMRNRILAALRKWAMASDEALRDLLDGIAINKPATDKDIAHAREIFFKYIDNPDIMKIKTIHGFCEEILHRFPLEAGLSPSWTLVSDSAQRVLLQDAFDKLIKRPDNSSNIYAAFEHIVGRVSETYLTDLMGILSSQYKQFFQIDDFISYREYFIETIKKFLKLDSVTDTGFDRKKLEKIVELAEIEQNGAKKPAQYINQIISLTKQYIDTTIDFQKYKGAYLKADGGKKSIVSKKDYLVAEQERVYELNQYYVNKMLFDDTVALFDLSAAFTRIYREIKQSRNLLDFEDLILYTRKLFSSPDTMGWVLNQLDLSLAHILVDEAQDTSPLQWDILRMMSGDFFTDGDTTQMPHSMFVVGDTKQSIYGFQGADPAAFATSRADIASQIEHNMRSLREVPLTQSFRSTAPILATVDRFFSDADIVAQTGFVNNTHKCFRKNDSGAVELHKLCSKQETEKTIQDYISEISDRIKSLIDSGKHKASDIMVLVQQRNPLAVPLVASLKRRGIEVAGSDRIILPQFPAVADLLNLIRWCLDTADDYSLCCVLRSPIFRMNQLDIFNVCKIKNDTNYARHCEDPNAPKMTVFEVLAQHHMDVYEQLSQYLIWSAQMAPYSFFDSVLNNNSVRKSMISALGEQVIDPLEEFMTICLAYERTQTGTLRHFLKWFITGGSEIKRDMDASSGVRIVTVHGSKGLEAPVVFLIDTVRTPKPEKILPIENSKYPVWLWSPREDSSASRADAADALMKIRIAEYYRLLYVAMTRARDELYIYGFTPNKTSGELSWHNQLWRVLASDSEQEYIRITNDDIK